MPGVWEWSLTYKGGGSRGQGQCVRCAGDSVRARIGVMPTATYGRLIRREAKWNKTTQDFPKGRAVALVIAGRLIWLPGGRNA